MLPQHNVQLINASSHTQHANNKYSPQLAINAFPQLAINKSLPFTHKFQYLVKIRDYSIFIRLRLCVSFPCFLNWKFISLVKFEEIKWKRSLRSALIIRKLTGISVLNAKGTILKKINISFIQHFVLANMVNTALFLILFNILYVYVHLPPIT